MQLGSVSGVNSAAPTPGAPTKISFGQLNAWNLFDDVDDPDTADDVKTPEDVAIRISKLAGQIGTDMGAPDIVTMQEVENTTVLNLLVKHPSLAKFGYEFILGAAGDPRGIRNAMIYRRSRVAPLDVQNPNPDTKLRPEHPGIAKLFSRAPLVVKFQSLGDAVAGAQFTLMSNHFKSKRGGDEFEDRRIAQGEFVGGLVDSLAGAGHVIVAGDLNALPEDAPYKRVLRHKDGSQRLFNSVDLLPKPDRYTYLYNGQKNLLDHFLVTPELRDSMEGVRIIHDNSGTSTKVRFDPTTTRGASDHDPILTTIAFPARR